MAIPVPRQYRQMLTDAADQAGLPQQVAAEQITVESDFDPNAVSPAGAEGIAQFMPGTWAQYGGGGSPFNPADAFPAYGDYMEALMSQESLSLRNALAAYNAGPANLPAGYGYADEILNAAGYPENAKGGKGGGSQTGKTIPYTNPFAGIPGLQPERIDQGVDFAGTGPVGAVGPGVVTYSGTGDTGWGPPAGADPGGFIRYKLTTGPAKGREVYVAEGVQPEVSVGEHVQAGQQIGTMVAPIETGWASGVGTQPLSQTAQAGGIGGGGPFPTDVGQNFDQMLVALGVPASPDVSGGGHGQLPYGMPGWGGVSSGVGKGIGGSAGGWNFDWGSFPIIGPILQGGEDTAHGLAAIAAVFEKIEHFIEWWSLPSTWLRIFCGLSGGLMVSYGVVTLARPRVNLPVLGSTPVVPGGELGPALGIASVTAGSVFLFFAFHNTGAGSVSELLGLIRQWFHGKPVPVNS